MTAAEQDKRVVLTFIAAMDAGDRAMAEPCLDRSAFTQAKGFGRFAGVRHYDTIVGTIGAFRTLFPDGMRMTVHSVTAEGDRVVVECEGNGVTCAGTAYHNQYCMVFTMRAHRIVQVNEYFCTLHADEVLWPLVEAMPHRQVTGG